MYPVGGVKISGDPSTKLKTTGLSRTNATAVKNPSSKATKAAVKTTPSAIKDAGKPIFAKQPKVASPHSPVAEKVSTDVSELPDKDSGRRKNSKRVYTSRRNAYKIKARLGDKPADALSEEEKSSLAWAMGIIAQHEAFLKDRTAPKRQRSSEEQLPGTKRPRPPHARTVRQHQRPFSEVAKDALVLALIDRSVSDGTISRTNWKKVELALLRVYWDILSKNPGPAPQCRDGGWHQGRNKLIACKDERTANLYKQAILSIGEVWPGAKLDVVPLNEVTNRPRSVARIPAETSEPKVILEMLQNSNPDLPTHNWKVVKVTEESESFRNAVIIINDESVAPITKERGLICYGFGWVRLRIYRSDTKNRSTSSVIAPKAPEVKGATCDDEVASTSSLEDSHSVSSLVGQFFGNMSATVDEDDLPKSDSEDIDVTVIHVQLDDDDEGHTD